MSVKKILSSIGTTRILTVPCQFITTTTKENFGRSELVFLIRRIASILNTVFISPMLIFNLNYYLATTLIFAITVVMALIFLFISDFLENDAFQLEALKLNKETKGIVMKILRPFYKRGKRILSFVLFCTEPLYFLIFYRSGYFRYNGLVNLKTSIVFLLSSVASTLLWSLFLLTIKLVYKMFS